MSRPRYALAKQEAENLLKKAGLNEPWVDVEKLAREVCDAEVEFEPFVKQGSDSMAAALIRQPGKRPIIGVNSNDTSQRQRFSIAHELGHLILHNDPYHVDTKMFLRDKTSTTAQSVMEIEANQFAANLLMPSWMLEMDLEELDVVDVDDTAQSLAERYRVSLQAMTLRLAKLLKYGL